MCLKTDCGGRSLGAYADRSDSGAMISEVVQAFGSEGSEVFDGADALGRELGKNSWMSLLGHSSMTRTCLPFAFKAPIRAKSSAACFGAPDFPAHQRLEV